MISKNSCGFDDLFIGFSVVAAIFAIVGAYGYDIYLASTQWMLVSAVLALWAIYLNIRKNK